MSDLRPIALGAVILAGPIVTFFLIAVLPFDYVSWLGGGLVGVMLAIATPGLVCIALLRLPLWQRTLAAMLYLVAYAPLGLIVGGIASVILFSRSH